MFYLFFRNLIIKNFFIIYLQNFFLLKQIIKLFSTSIKIIFKGKFNFWLIFYKIIQFKFSSTYFRKASARLGLESNRKSAKSAKNDKEHKQLDELKEKVKKKIQKKKKNNKNEKKIKNGYFYLIIF